MLWCEWRTPACPVDAEMTQHRPVPIRPGRDTDLPALTALYNHYVLHTDVTFDVDPFTVDQRESWFEHYAATGPHRLLIAEVGGVAVGYVTSSSHRPKAAYRRSVETAVYLHPGYVGRGLGRALYEALVAELAGEDVHRAFAGIAMPNPASVTLHRRVGFTPIGTYSEIGFKNGHYIDVDWFQLALPLTGGDQ